MSQDQMNDQIDQAILGLNPLTGYGEDAVWRPADRARTALIAAREALAARAEGAPAAEGFDIRASIERIGRAHSDAYNQNIGHNTVVAIEAELRAALSPPAAEGKEDDEDALRSEVLTIFKANKMANDESLAILIAERLAPRLNTPAPAAEPVAWLYEWSPHQFEQWSRPIANVEDPRVSGVRRYRNVTPLYTSPPPEPVAISREDIEAALEAKIAEVGGAFLIVDALSKLSGYPLVEGEKG